MLESSIHYILHLIHSWLLSFFSYHQSTRRVDSTFSSSFPLQDKERTHQTPRIQHTFQPQFQSTPSLLFYFLAMTDLSSRYGPQLRQLKAIFPTWDEGDLAFTLQDVKGNVDEAAMMITEGKSNSQCTRSSLPVLSVLSLAAQIAFDSTLHYRRPSNPIHRSNHKKEGLKSAKQGYHFETLEP